VDNPLESIDPDDLQRQIENFHKKEFKDADLVTLEELCKGAKLAISKLIPKPGVIVDRLPN
jgi:hypothetical protein